MNFHFQSQPTITDIRDHLERETALSVAERLLAYYKQYPERWIKGNLAREWDVEKNECGLNVPPFAPEAACFCLGGGLAHFMYEGEDRAPYIDNVFHLEINRLARKMVKTEYGGVINAIYYFNDDTGTTFEDVVAFLEHMITVLKDPQVTYA